MCVFIYIYIYSIAYHFHIDGQDSHGVLQVSGASYVITPISQTPFGLLRNHKFLPSVYQQPIRIKDIITCLNSDKE